MRFSFRVYTHTHTHTHTRAISRHSFSSLLLILALLFNACTDDETLLMEIPTLNNVPVVTAQTKSAPNNPNFEPENDGKIELGAKLVDNPFSVDNVNASESKLYGSSAVVHEPTHLYVKWSPKNAEHLMALLDWETEVQIPVFDFPLDRKITKMGTYYVDPAVSDSLLTYRYASVPVGTQLPTGIPHEVLDKLYLNKQDPFILAESFRKTGQNAGIEEYFGFLEEIDPANLPQKLLQIIPDPPTCDPGCNPEMRIDDSTVPIRIFWVCDCTPPPPPPTNACTCVLPTNRRNPAGCVRVDDDGLLKEVRGARVVVRDNWFEADFDETDNNGCWHVNKSYAGRMWMWVRFVNTNVKVRDFRYWAGLITLQDYAGVKNGPTFNNILHTFFDGQSNNDQTMRAYWAAAHSLNTVAEYREEAAADGIPLPRTGLNWSNRRGDGPGSAAMLQGHVFSSWPAFIALRFAPIPYVASTALLPDITNRYGSQETAASFNGTGFHELGHATHHTLVGEAYWVPYRNHIINNGGYGFFGSFASSSNPGHVALGEAVGNFIGNKYGETNSGGEAEEWDNNFIPQGLMFDLIDDLPDDLVTDPNNAAISRLDNISGFTPQMIFNGLTPASTNSIRAFRDRLRVLHLADTPNTLTDYNAFVDVYDVFN